MKSLLIAALALGLPRFEPLHAQIPSTVHARFVAALRPNPGQAIVTTRDSAPSYFASAVFFLARRKVPPFPIGEDERPNVAAIVATQSDTLLVLGLANLDSAWRLVAASRPENDQLLKEKVFALLSLTAEVSKRDLIADHADGRRKARPAFLRSASALREVTAPRLFRKGDATLVEFYAVGSLGLYRYDITIDRMNRWHGERTLLSSWIGQM